MIEISDFVLNNVFHHIPEQRGPYEIYDEMWWREVKDGGEGYILLWKDGNYHHTYHHPENTFGPSDTE